MKTILRDLQRVLEGVPERRTAQFVRRILGAPRVFVFGLGRSGLVARMFGMRLVHLGRDATIVGDTTTPAIREKDVLVVCSRTGQSPFLHHALHLARTEGAFIIAVTGERGAPLAKDVSLVVRLPIEVADGRRRQPMGSLFEQALLLYLDGVVLQLMAALNKTSEDMERVHANLP